MPTLHDQNAAGLTSDPSPGHALTCSLCEMPADAAAHPVARLNDNSFLMLADKAQLKLFTVTV